MDVSMLSDPIMQYGFAGLGAVLFAFLCWLVRRLLELLKESSTVIANNTAALKCLEKRQEEGLRIYSDLRDQLLSRPCLLRRMHNSRRIPGSQKRPAAS